MSCCSVPYEMQCACPVLCIPSRCVTLYARTCSSQWHILDPHQPAVAWQYLINYRLMHLYLGRLPWELLSNIAR